MKSSLIQRILMCSGVLLLVWIGSCNLGGDVVADADASLQWGCGHPNGVVVDSSGNVYVTGCFMGNIDFDPGPGTEQHTSNGSIDAFLSKFDTDGEFQWVRTWGGNYSDDAEGVAVDGSGNVYVTGFFTERADFDPSSASEEHSAFYWDHPISYSDMPYFAFLRKYDSDGGFQWVRAWGGDGRDVGNGVVVDGSFNIYVCGCCSGTIDFDPGPGIEKHTGHRFLSVFDSEGEFQWVQTWSDVCGFRIALDVDEFGNTYIADDFAGTVDFDPGLGTNKHTSNGQRDAVLCKLDSSGELQWVRTWGGPYDDRGLGVCLESASDVYVTGDFVGTVDFDPGMGTDEHVSNRGSGVFLSKFDSSGVFEWVRTWGDTGSARYSRLASDGSGGVYVTGLFAPTVDFDPGPGIDEPASNGCEDVFLTKFDSSGEFQWVRTWGGARMDITTGIAVDAFNDIYVTGKLSGIEGLDIGDWIGDEAPLGGGMFLTKFDSNGELQWARTWWGVTDTD